MTLNIIVDRSNKPEDDEYPWTAALADRPELEACGENMESAVGNLICLLASRKDHDITVEHAKPSEPKP